MPDNSIVIDLDPNDQYEFVDIAGPQRSCVGKLTPAAMGMHFRARRQTRRPRTIVKVPAPRPVVGRPMRRQAARRAHATAGSDDGDGDGPSDQPTHPAPPTSPCDLGFFHAQNLHTVGAA